MGVKPELKRTANRGESETPRQYVGVASIRLTV